jgi:hypothetical protein
MRSFSILGERTVLASTGTTHFAANVVPGALLTDPDDRVWHRLQKWLKS